MIFRIAIARIAIVIMAGLAWAGSAAAEEPAGDAAKPVAYVLLGKNLKQVLQVRPRGNREIEFELTIEARCGRTVSGIATSQGGDPEMDEDEDGVAYPAREYEYEGGDGLELWIRVDMEKHLHARLKISDTRKKCGFSEGLMTRARAGTEDTR